MPEVAIFYPSSQLCDIESFLLILQKQPRAAPNLLQRGENTATESCLLRTRLCADDSEACALQEGIWHMAHVTHARVESYTPKAGTRTRMRARMRTLQESDNISLLSVTIVDVAPICCNHHSHDFFNPSEGAALPRAGGLGVRLPMAVISVQTDTPILWRKNLPPESPESLATSEYMFGMPEIHI